MQISTNNYPLIMGIINLTPDSFYSHSMKCDSNLFDHLEYKYADIIDVGCESSRPGSKPVSEKKELLRLSQFIDKGYNFPGILSIDTYKPVVARFALENGFNMINDIKAGGDNDLMLNLAAEYDCSIVLMHMNGVPETMQDRPIYDDIMGDIQSFFEKKLKTAQALGIKRKNIILDPGIGFGKRVEDNDVILNNLGKLQQFNHPILIGLSRKSFLSINGDGPASRLPATLGATVLAIQKGIDILRVHDIEETYKLKTILQRINNLKTNDTDIIYN
jgi:dihydropteroate synthase